MARAHKRNCSPPCAPKVAVACTRLSLRPSSQDSQSTRAVGRSHRLPARSSGSAGLTELLRKGTEADDLGLGSLKVCKGGAKGVEHVVSPSFTLHQNGPGGGGGGDGSGSGI